MDISTQQPGFEGIIRSVEGDQAIVLRLTELGFISSEVIRVKQVAFFGEPIMVEVRGAVVALRKNEAKCLLL